MEKIKISDINLLGEIAKQLKLPTTAIINGITQEQAELIEKLEIRESEIDLLKNFPNLKELTIIGLKKANNGLQDVTISDLSHLEELKILVTQGIKSITLQNLPQLHFMNISGNINLQEINGIENLEDIAQLTLRDNGLKKIFDIKKIAESTQAEMHLDLSMLHLVKERYTDFSQVEHNNTMAKCISWIDVIEGQHPLKLYYGEGIQIEQKAEQILNQIIDDSMTDVEKICAINTWMVENVTYDDGAIEERDKRD